MRYVAGFITMSDQMARELQEIQDAWLRTSERTDEPLDGSDNEWDEDYWDEDD